MPAPRMPRPSIRALRRRILRARRGARSEPLRAFLAFSALLLMAGSFAGWMHAVSDGDPGLLRSLRVVGAVEVDPFAVGWVPGVAGVLLLAGLWYRSGLSWVAVSLLGVFGMFFAPWLGWGYLVATFAFAVGLAWMPPLPGRPALRPLEDEDVP